VNVQYDDLVKLRSRRARRNKIFRFAESKSFPQLMPEQQEIDARLEDDRANRQIPDFPDETAAAACCRFPERRWM
jgi:hypothetical protein